MTNIQNNTQIDKKINKKGKRKNRKKTVVEPPNIKLYNERVSIPIINNNNNILFYSSFIFITNICSAGYNQYFFYSFLFLFLTITSIIYHYPSDNITIDILDKICILSIITYGGYIFYNKTKVINQILYNRNIKGIYNNVFIKYIIYISIVVLCFLSTIFLYAYGYIVEQYCFHKHKYTSDVYHGLLHLLSSIGHHFIVFL